MAVTSQEQTLLIKLVIGMFGIAPGNIYLPVVTKAFDELGHSLPDAAAALGNLPQFRALYPKGMAAAAFATIFASQFLTPLGLHNDALAKGLVLDLFNQGVAPEQIILQAIVALNSTTASEYAAARATLDNKAEVAYYHAQILGRTETDFTLLAKVLENVTANPASVDAAKLVLNPPPPPAPEPDPPAPPPPPPAPPPLAATLTGGVDTITLTASGERIDAPAGTLNSADNLDGGGGTDLLTATLASVNIGPTIANIENIEITVNASSTIDATSISGVTKFTVQGAGNLTLSGNIAGTTIDASALTGSLAITGTPSGAMNIKGGTGNDTLKGSGLNDTLDGGGGDDTLNGLGGVDSISAGNGDDTLIVDSIRPAGTVLNGGAGTDTVRYTTVTPGQNVLADSTFIGIEIISIEVPVIDWNVGAGLAGIAIRVTDSSSVTLRQLGNHADVTVGGIQPDITLVLATPGGATDTLKLSLSADVSPTTLTDIAGLETLNLVLNGAAGTSNTVTTNAVTAAQLLTGAADFTVSNALATTSFDASGFTGNLKVQAGSSGTKLTGGTGTDTLLGGGGNDTLQLGSQGANRLSGADTLTTGAGNDVVRFVGNAATGTGGLSDYSTIAQTTDLVVGTPGATDQLAFSADNADFSLAPASGAGTAATGLARGATAQGLTATDAMVVQDVAQNAAAAGFTANVSFIKLTTAMAFTTDVKGTFAAALGTASVTGLAANGNYLLSAYDTTNSRMVVAVVNVGGNADGDTALASNDFVNADIAVVGVVAMTAGDYATFGASHLAAAF